MSKLFFSLLFLVMAAFFFITLFPESWFFSAVSCVLGGLFAIRGVRAAGTARWERYVCAFVLLLLVAIFIADVWSGVTLLHWFR